MRSAIEPLQPLQHPLNRYNYGRKYEASSFSIEETATGLSNMRLLTAASLLILASISAPRVLPAVGLPSALAAPAVFWQSMAKTSGDEKVLNAFKDQLSNVIVENVSGTVETLLTDDVEGSRHQRFIVRIAGGHTVLVVHNIDLAPRVNSLKKGDRVLIKGEYEWNEKGGLIHWTHRDPNSRHEDGWIIHQNLRYE